MKSWYNKKLFRDNAAVSEEFTALPALVVISIGLTLFLIMFSSAEESYNIQKKSIDEYQTAGFLLNHILDPDAPIMKDKGVINYPFLDSINGKNYLESIRQQTGNINFSLLLSFKNEEHFYPYKPPDVDRIAVSQPIAVYLNEVETTSGRITIILWWDIIG